MLALEGDPRVEEDYLRLDRARFVVREADLGAAGSHGVTEVLNASTTPLGARWWSAPQARRARACTGLGRLPQAETRAKARGL